MTHLCHWPDCKKEVPPRLWGCRYHWFKLPPHLRSQIWSTYVPGQEVRRDPSPEYLEVAARVQKWCMEQIKIGEAKMSDTMQSDTIDDILDNYIKDNITRKEAAEQLAQYFTDPDRGGPDYAQIEDMLYAADTVQCMK